MSDINKLSFSISGQSTLAQNSIRKLITKVTALDSAFDKATVSGTNFVNMLGQIGTITSTLGAGMSGANVQNKQFAQTVSKTTTKLTKQNTVITKSASKWSLLTNAINKNKKANTAHISGLNKIIGRLGQIAFLVYSLRTALRFLNEGTANAIAYVENLNLFMVALGENTSKATGFINEMAESLYLDEAQLTRVQGLFYQISESLGLSSDKAYTLSENFTKLAYDLASFYNITIEDAVVKLQAGLVGETEPLRRIGIIITENNLAETARNLGIKKSIRNMTEQEKIQLRYVTALQQTKNAQGDMARTLKEPENLLRIMKEQFTKLSRQLGNAFIPAIEKIVPEIIGITMALQKLAKTIATTLGYEAPEISDELGGHVKTVADETKDVADNTGTFATNLRKALQYTRALSNATTGIDELNIVSETSSFDFTNLFDVGDVTEATSSIDQALEDYNNRMKETNGVFDDVVKKWSIRIDNFINDFKVGFSDAGEAISELFDTIFGGGSFSIDRKNLFNIIGGTIEKIVEDLTKVVKKLKEIWNDYLVPIMQSVAPDWFNDLQSQTVVDLVANIIEMFILFKAVTIASSVLTMFGNLITLAPYVASFALLIGYLKTLIDIIRDFKKEKEELGDEFSAMNFWIEGFGLQGFAEDVDARLIQPFRDLKEILEEVYKKIQAIIDGLLYLVSFGIIGEPLPVSDETKEKTRNIWESTKKKTKDVFDEAKDKFEDAKDWLSNFKFRDLIPQKNPLPYSGAFANGGTPQKGSLFIAGEKGAELVGDLGNGGTSVINKKQAKQLGIPMFANGVNVPKWTRHEQKKSSRITTHADGNEITDTMDIISDGYKEMFGVLGSKIQKTSFFKTLKSGGNAIGDFAKTAFDGVKNAGLFMWEGVSNSKAFKGTIDILTKFKDVVKGVLGVYKNAGKVVVNFYEAFKSADVAEIMKESPTDGKSTIDQQNVMSGVIGGMLEGTVAGPIFSVMESINDGVLGSFIDALPNFILAGMDMIVSLVKGVQKALPTLVAKIPDIVTQMVAFLTDENALNTIINGLIDMVIQIAIALPDIIMALIDAIPTVIISIVDALISNVGQFAKVGVILAVALVDGLINTVIAGVNALIKLINKIPFVNIGLIKYSSNMADSVATAMGYAEGGYPTQGQMFIAREAGVELVGEIGGRTSVMNNEQIVESVSRGVYKAVAQAMGETNKNATVINLDGKRVSERLDVASRTRGNTYGMEGF